MIQHRLVETADRAGDIVFPRLQLIDFLVNTRAGNINEAGAYKKFVNRGSTQFLCKVCLAEKLGVAVEDIDRKIEEFKMQGCTLFV